MPFREVCRLRREEKLLSAGGQPIDLGHESAGSRRQCRPPALGDIQLILITQSVLAVEVRSESRTKFIARPVVGELVVRD